MSFIKQITSSTLTLVRPCHPGKEAISLFAAIDRRSVEINEYVCTAAVTSCGQPGLSEVTFFQVSGEFFQNVSVSFFGCKACCLPMWC